MKKLAVFLLLVLIISSFVSIVKLARASGTVYIRADGLIDPPTAPVSTMDNVTYFLTGNVTSYYADGIVIERDNVVVDGADWALQGTGGGTPYKGIDLSGRSNVTIKNARITTFYYGINLDNSSRNCICGNNITNTDYGVFFGCTLYSSNSSGNSVSGNNIMDNQIGIGVYYSDNNSFSANNITSNYYGIYLQDSSNNSFNGNNITNNDYGIELTAPYHISANNSISGNIFVSDGLYVLDVGSYPHIVNDNLVNGKPLVYLDGASDLIVEDAGQVVLKDCGNITIRNLNLSDTTVGVQLWQSDYTTIKNNNIANNQIGILLQCSTGNSIRENNITANNMFDIDLSNSYNNKLYHNNLGSNVYLSDSGNVWDDGYPSGGNYWNPYYGTADYRSGPNQDQPGSDVISDSARGMDENNTDHYPLMSPWLPPPEHELGVHITAPTSLRLGSSAQVDAIVTNYGSNDEVNVELLLLVNGNSVKSTTIPTLEAGDSHTLSHLWTPAAQGTYNVTAYATPVLGETSLKSNQKSAFIAVVQIGVKTGDWMKYDYTVTGWPAGTPYPEWLKVEFLTVEGTNSTVHVTMHMSDGPEQNATIPVDVVAGGQALGLSGFVIPANLTTGDIVYMSGYGNITIAGETTRSYAGASRTLVHASFHNQYWIQLTYYWDKQTGVMVEASTTSGTITGTGKATETNIWQAAPGFPIDPTILVALTAIVAVLVIALLLIRRRKKPMEAVKPDADRHE